MLRQEERARVHGGRPSHAERVEQIGRPRRVDAGEAREEVQQLELVVRERGEAQPVGAGAHPPASAEVATTGAAGHPSRVPLFVRYTSDNPAGDLHLYAVSESNFAIMFLIFGGTPTTINAWSIAFLEQFQMPIGNKYFQVPSPFWPLPYVTLFRLHHPGEGLSNWVGRLALGP